MNGWKHGRQGEWRREQGSFGDADIDISVCSAAADEGDAGRSLGALDILLRHRLFVGEANGVRGNVVFAARPAPAKDGVIETALQRFEIASGLRERASDDGAAEPRADDANRSRLQPTAPEFSLLKPVGAFRGA